MIPFTRYGIWFVLSLWSVDCYSSSEYHDPAAHQLEIFKKHHPFPIGTISEFSGQPVEIRQTNTLNQRLIFNGFFMDTMTHFSRERIPERVVHASGAGAFGYFEVTNDITNVCKAKLFSNIGKRTPVVVRFSTVAGQIGSSELVRDIRGFAVKFYTEEGNFDIVGLNIPVFSIKDPLFFPSFVHIQKRNPQTNLNDDNMLWDFLTQRPEMFHLYMYRSSDFGIPLGYSYIRGFAIHTYQVYNSEGESYYVRFHFYPDLGTRTLSNEVAEEISGRDPYNFTHQLFNDIENRNYPSWQLKVQILTIEDVKNANFDVFDVTRLLPIEKYPLIPVGKLVLNRNQKNYFAEIEQLAFCPANLVPGILGAPDKIFEARRLSYRDTQNYRLGANFFKIPVNCPFALNYNNNSYSLLTYTSDGRPPVNNLGNAPNYFPNSFNGPLPYYDKNMPDLIDVIQNNDYSFDQIHKFYMDMDAGEKERLVTTIASSLRKTEYVLQQKGIKILYEIHPSLGNRVAAFL